eukprot:scaffold16571_cov76-Attheya_sp.AAC.8
MSRHDSHAWAARSAILLSCKFCTRQFLCCLISSFTLHGCCHISTVMHAHSLEDHLQNTWKKDKMLLHILGMRNYYAVLMYEPGYPTFSPVPSLQNTNGSPTTSWLLTNAFSKNKESQVQPPSSCEIAYSCADGFIWDVTTPHTTLSNISHISHIYQHSFSIQHLGPIQS